MVSALHSALALSLGSSSRHRCGHAVACTGARAGSQPPAALLAFRPCCLLAVSSSCCVIGPAAALGPCHWQGRESGQEGDGGGSPCCSHALCPGAMKEGLLRQLSSAPCSPSVLLSFVGRDNLSQRLEVSAGSSTGGKESFLARANLLHAWQWCPGQPDVPIAPPGVAKGGTGSGDSPVPAASSTSQLLPALQPEKSPTGKSWAGRREPVGLSDGPHGAWP